MKKRMLAILIAIILSLNLGIAAAEALPVEEPEELYGSPWVNSTVIGNLPPTAPEVKDDLYTNVNYDALAEANASGDIYIPMALDGLDELQSAVTAMVTDEGLTGDELTQLRLFWEQAADMDALREAGYSPIQPYLDRIGEADSIEALNAVLTADDFPFSPYLAMPTAPLSLKEENGVWIWPALSLTSDYISGANYYTDPIEDVQVFIEQVLYLMEYVYYARASLQVLGVPEDALADTMLSLFNSEVAYVSEGYNDLKATLQDYGYIADAIDRLTLEELDGLCARFPLTATLKKFGKDKSSAFVVLESKWLKALDGLWTEENLGTLKLLTQFKLLLEVSPFLDQDPSSSVRSAFGETILDEATNPWSVCDRVTTFGHLLAKLFVTDALGSGRRETLTDMTQGLIGEYRELINQTEWISDTGREKALEKLDHMRLNILEPDGGYIDFSGLKLTPSSEGGTLFDSYLAIKAYLNERENEQIGQPGTADLAWKVVNPTVSNCIYDQGSNSVSLYPGFMTSYNCPADASEAELLGTIGNVIAHEISHAFDFTGSQCDAFGLGNPILTEADREVFLAKVKSVEDYYDRIVVMPGVNCDGTLLRVENAADLTGMKAALLLAKARGLDLEAFFRAYARLYSMAVPEAYLPIFLADTHALNHLRVNVNAQMMDEFYEVFGVEEGDGMYVKPEDRLNIWG